MVNYVVTGATAYIGSSLVKRLIKEQHSVLCVVRPSSDLSQLKEVIKIISLCVYDGEIKTLQESFLKFNPDVVFNLASCFIAEHKTSDINDLINSNILFGTHLLEAMYLSKVANIINVGTSWQHYQNHNYNPVCLYAATKQAFIDIIKFYVNAKGFSCITLKLFDTYGPGDPRKKLVHLLEFSANANKTLSMSGGQQKLDLVHIDDVINAFMIASEKVIKYSPGVYDEFGVATKKLFSLREIVSNYEKQAGKKINIDWGKLSYREREVMEPWSEFKMLTGWEPYYLFPQGL